MMCFKDMTFCDNKECVAKCDRRLTDKILEAAKRWWGSDKAPVCVADFSGQPCYKTDSELQASEGWTRNGG